MAIVTPGASPSVHSEAPATGATVSPSYTGQNMLVALTPAGTLATLTINYPSASQFPGMIVRVNSSQIITALTLTPSVGSIIGAVTTLALGGFCAHQSDGTNWRRIA
jgi:hypothetical protein